MHYTEINKLSIEDFCDGTIVGGGLLPSYDAYVFNFHPITLYKAENINPEIVAKFNGIKCNLYFEVGINDPYPETIYKNFNHSVFDRHIVFDPTLERTSEKIYPFWRPITGFRTKHIYETVPKIPIIGTHGLPNSGKNYIDMMRQASIEFERSVVRINVPHATHMGEEITNYIAMECRSQKPENVDLILTHTYFNDRNDLITWCGQNDLNVFLYSRTDPGISSAADEALLSGSPISISKNDAFRHIHKYITPFPEHSFSQSILNSQIQIEAVKDQLDKKSYIDRFKKMIVG